MLSTGRFRWFLVPCLAFVSFGWAPEVFAQEKPAVSIALEARMVKVGEDGKETLVATDKAAPGQIMEYSALCKNESANTVTNLQPIIPIPVGTEYVLESAKPVALSASTDGSVFKPLPLQRDVKQADGSIKQEPAPAADYRAVKWSISELRPDAVSIVSLRVRVAANPKPSVTPASK